MKIRKFPDSIIGNMKLFIIPHLRKSPGKIVVHVGTDDVPHAKLFNTFKDPKSFIQKYAR